MSNPVEMGLPVIGRIVLKEWMLGPPKISRLRALFGVDRTWDGYIGRGREPLFILLPPGGWRMKIHAHPSELNRLKNSGLPILPDNTIAYRMRWYSHMTLVWGPDDEIYRPEKTFRLTWEAFWRELKIIEEGGYELVLEPHVRWLKGKGRL